jgi:hypothetical protein
LQKCPGDFHQFRGFERLDEVMIRPQALRAPYIRLVGFGGGYDDFGPADLRLGAELLEYPVAMHPGEHQVQKDQIGTLGHGHPKSSLPVRRGQNLVSLSGQHIRDERAQDFIVINDKYLSHSKDPLVKILPEDWKKGKTTKRRVVGYFAVAASL